MKPLIVTRKTVVLSKAEVLAKLCKTRAVLAMLRGGDIRTKGDLRDWTGSPTFHLIQE